VGTFRYPANVHAAQLLIDEVWPKIRARVPTARLNVVGGPSDALKAPAGADTGVTLAGFVEDIDAAYRQARVVCCPIFFGSGTRIKIIEAAGHARAIVSTALGAEGIDLVDGQEIIHANDVDALATACVRLLQNEAEANALGAKARAKAAAVYDREKVVAGLVAHFSKPQL
jgi:glycosyltransferase involved in cell wall biosynthesis